MTEEVAAEPVTSEPVVESTPAPEPVPEPTPEIVEPEIVSTAQPVEPLSPEPVEAPEIEVETEASAPEPQPSVPVLAPTIQKPDSRSLFAKAREIIQFRKRKKLEKIMNLYLKKQSINNDDVEKLLHVSDATATRYLDQLEREGKIQKQGSGKYVSYSRI